MSFRSGNIASVVVKLSACIFAAIGIVGLLMLASCAQGPAGSQESGESSESASFSVSDIPKASAENSDAAASEASRLVSIMELEDAIKLLVGAQGNVDRYWIATHPDSLDVAGKAMQEKLLRLAADEDEAVAYVRDFPARYPEPAATSDDPNPDGENAAASDSAEGDGFPKVVAGNGRVPHLYQWDQRWGYTVYSSNAFGLTGCGPTAFAMAYQATLGTDDLSPYDMGQLAQQTGYMDEFEGTDASFMVDLSRSLGMYSESITIDEARLYSAFADGCAVVANVGNGYFSRSGGHFLVLAGLDENGKLVMNDPYSAANSRRTWDIDFILSQTMGLYAFWKLPDGNDVTV